jgi:hypothetical protein
VMVDQILRRLPIDVRDLMGPDEVKKATVRARKQAATVRYAGNGAWGEVRLNETTCKVVTRV